MSTAGFPRTERLRAVRPLAIAAMCALLVSGVGAPWSAPAAFGAPRITIIDSSPKFLVHPAGLVVCNNEKKTIGVGIQIVVTYKKRGQTGTFTGYRDVGLGHIIKAAVLDANVGEITPPFQTTAAPKGIVYFRFTAKHPGTTKIRFNEVTNRIPNLQAREIIVVVEDCFYKVSGYGEWKIPDGFQPNLYSEFSDVYVRPIGNDEYQGFGTVKNVAAAAPRGGCSAPSMQVTDGGVAIKGTDDGNGTIKWEITYTTVTATTTVFCRIKGPPRKDVAHVRKITRTSASFQDARLLELSHILDTHVAVPGETRLIITIVRQPPP
jgi:hypothetical protein